MMVPLRPRNLNRPGRIVTRSRLSGTACVLGEGCVTPHPDYDRLARAVRRCLPLAAPWRGDVFRFAAPRWSTAAQLLTGEGAYRHGGRWCPIGTLRAVDASLDPETALAEVLVQYRRFGWAIRDAMPKLSNAVVVRLHRVLDLTAGPVRRRLVLSWGRIMAERWWERQANNEEALTQGAGSGGLGSQVGRLACPIGGAARRCEPCVLP